MEAKILYMGYPACIPRILNKIKEAQTPDRFTYDFLETKLGFKGGNYKQFVSLAKRINFLNTDGSPTDLYKKFRNQVTSGPAMASAMKIGYAEIFERNEYANELPKEELKGLVVEITGLDAKNRMVQYICQTFENLKQFSNFNSKLTDEPNTNEDAPQDEHHEELNGQIKKMGLNLSYTINLVLPKTDDPAVFNAIFRALRDNLMKD